jgi:hypothetical protein
MILMQMRREEEIKAEEMLEKFEVRMYVYVCISVCIYIYVCVLCVAEEMLEKFEVKDSRKSGFNI